jgi:hypothetical protein
MTCVLWVALLLMVMAYCPSCNHVDVAFPRLSVCVCHIKSKRHIHTWNGSCKNRWLVGWGLLLCWTIARCLCNHCCPLVIHITLIIRPFVETCVATRLMWCWIVMHWVGCWCIIQYCVTCISIFGIITFHWHIFEFGIHLHIFEI